MIQQFHFWVYTQKKKKMKARTQTGSLYTDVHSYIVHNGQKKIETIQMSTKMYE